MNRTDLQQLAEERIRDAEALLNAGRWSGAYYLCGYAVECALKACIAKRTNVHDFPDKTKVQRAHTHNLPELLDVAGLKTDFRHASGPAANPTLHANWQVLEHWNEQARYQLWSEAEARKLYQAATDPTTGVLPWVKGRW